MCRTVFIMLLSWSSLQVLCCELSSLWHLKVSRVAGNRPEPYRDSFEIFSNSQTSLQSLVMMLLVRFYNSNLSFLDFSFNRLENSVYEHLIDNHFSTIYGILYFYLPILLIIQNKSKRLGLLQLS